MKQTFKGHYTYDSEQIQKAIGFERTFFTIEIEFSDDDTFKGTVQDDISSGGMNGIGAIEGEIHENAIFFIKQMPFKSLIDPKGNRITSNKKHSPLYYEGHLIAPNKYAGTWVFEKKWGFFLGFIPIKYTPGKGTWEMDKVCDLLR